MTLMPFARVKTLVYIVAYSITVIDTIAQLYVVHEAFQPGHVVIIVQEGGQTELRLVQESFIVYSIEYETFDGYQPLMLAFLRGAGDTTYNN